MSGPIWKIDVKNPLYAPSIDKLDRRAFESRRPRGPRGLSGFIAVVSDALTSRRLPLAGEFNLRDMGGYTTREGRLVKRGLLYRSGMMSMLTHDDEAYLSKLDIAFVCDLRRPGERTSQPTRWCEPGTTQYWTRDYAASSGVLGDVLRSTEPTVEAMRAAMLQLYRELAVDHAPSYKVLFEQLLGGNMPLLFNCSAGKDRTGVAGLLILHALDVPYETILADYLLTNEADFDRLVQQSGRTIQAVAQERPEVLAPLIAADAAYLASFVTELNANHDGIDGYLANRLGVDEAAKAALRSLLLE